MKSCEVKKNYLSCGLQVVRLLPQALFCDTVVVVNAAVWGLVLGPWSFLPTSRCYVSGWIK